MLEVTADHRVERLVDRLAGVLATPPADPMAPEWIVVASAGAQRWLGLALSRRLGAGPGRADGVAANLDLIFPDRLEQRVLTPGVDHATEPWLVDRVAWAVLQVLDDAHRPPPDELGPVRRLAPGATRWARARRIADLFDHYLRHRPEMIRRWAAHEDVDSGGRPLADRHRWQPHLWRLARDLIGCPSPAELRPERLDSLRAGDCPDDVPDRLALFGITTIPGGPAFLELLDALGTQREVQLLLHEPSPAMTARLCASRLPDSPVPARRADDRSADQVRHPLLRSWARPAREGLVLVGDRLAPPVVTDPPPAPATLLARVQADLRADADPAPGPRMVPPVDDRSIRFHECHGPTRQVEVLRDQILHLLADDPTLTEDDVVVLCPSLDEFAPLLESVLGPSGGPADPGPPHGAEVTGAPRLAYRVTDRSLRATHPLLGALGALVELLDSRFSDAAVLDFVNLEPVRMRFALDDDDLVTLAAWIDRANTRWGLDGPHRERWGVPGSHGSGSWRATLDRLLLGVAVSEDPEALAVGEVLPIGVEGTDVAVLGRIADLLDRLARLADDARRDRPVHEWVDLFEQVSTSLFAVDPEATWQTRRLTGVLQEIRAQATPGDEPSGVALALADMRHLLGGRLRGTGGRSDFFRGGITVTSLTPLRGLPFRVVCLLGMDQSAFASGAPDGDDLTAATPHIGDRDPRADQRQVLLEAVLAAQHHLMVLYDGHDVITNQPIPPAVAVAELQEVVAATIDPAEQGDGLGRLTHVHPRQAFDERNFTTTDAGGSGRPWSFDPVALAGAAARVTTSPPRRFMSEPLTTQEPQVVDLDDLRGFIENPPRYFLQQVLQVVLPKAPERHEGRGPVAPLGASGIARPADGRDLVLDLGDLDRWKLSDAYLAHRRAGGDSDGFMRRERAGDRLPPGRLAEAALADMDELTEKFLRALDELGAAASVRTQRPIDLTLPDGTRLVGTATDDGGTVPGPIAASISPAAPKQQLPPWLDLLALTATDPSVAWSAVLVNRPSSSKGRTCQIRRLEIPLTHPVERRQRAVEALEVVVDLHRRGRREPLPLFPRLSPKLHAGKGAAGAWSNRFGQSDDGDRWIRMAFDDADFERITSLPVRADDPPGPGVDRASRYAHRLWGAVEASTSAAEPVGR